MNRLNFIRRSRRRGFTLLELQIAIILLAFGIATLASLMTTQHRLLSRLQGHFKPDATICVTRSIDPWVTKLNTPARISAEPIAQSPPPGISVVNDVAIIAQFNDITDQSIVVTADVTELP